MQGDRTYEEDTAALAATRRNRLTVETALDYLSLPVSTLTPRPDVVHVTVIDAEQLNRWHYVLGGEIKAATNGDGVALWTLITNSPTRGDGSSVPVHVHAVITDGEDVLIEVHRGVAA